MHNGEQKGKRVPHQAQPITPFSTVNLAVVVLAIAVRMFMAAAHNSMAEAGWNQWRKSSPLMKKLAARSYLLHDVLSDDQEDPGTKAARKLDWETFMSGLSEREKAVVLQMIEGKTFSSIGRKLKLSPGTVKTTRIHLAQKAAEVMGADILVQAARLPQWKEDLNACRERVDLQTRKKPLRLLSW